MAAFPAVPPREKPTDRPLSAAMHRLYDQWSPLQDAGNEFFTSFRYYLYYQTFTGRFRRERGDYCDVSMAWADSPDGPWQW